MDLLEQNEVQNDDAIDQEYLDILEPGQQQQQVAQPQPEIQQQPQEFEYTALGKTVREPLDMVLKRASMGYDYAQKMEGFKRERESFEAERQKLEAEKQGLQRWRELDEYARQNPAWREHLEQSWASKSEFDQIADPDDPTYKKVTGLEGQFGELQSTVQQMAQYMQQKQQQEQDNILESEIKSVRDKYPDIDFTLTDDSGKSLEYKVLEFGTTHKFPTFDAAFKVFYHDKLMERAQLLASKQAAENMEARKKAGIIGTSSTPTTGQSSYVPSKNWNDVSAEDILKWEGL